MALVALSKKDKRKQVSVMIQDGSDQESKQLARQIKEYLSHNSLNTCLSDMTYEILALQLIDSVEQEAAIKALLDRDIGEQCCDPTSEEFNPIKAVIYLKDKDYDEACWLSFLLIYTNDSEKTDWAFMRKLYGGVGLNLKTALTWQQVNKSFDHRMALLEQLSSSLALSDPKPKFGHHRAYESINHLPIAVSSYIDFINEQGGHQTLFRPKGTTLDKTAYFQKLYALIRKNVYRFGRLSTFEYLCLLGKMGLADVEPDSCYIAEASGPKRGAKLLFGMLDDAKLDDHAIGLADYLNVGYQELEAAICHWQKSPDRYIQH